VALDGSAELRNVEREIGDGKWVLTNGGEEIKLEGFRLKRGGVVQGP
jgi:hypothetical protein